MTILNIGEQLDSSRKLNVLFCQVRFVTIQWFNSPCDPWARCTVFLVGLLVQMDVLGTLRHLSNVPWKTSPQTHLLLIFV